MHTVAAEAMIYWKDPVSGSWTDASKWSTGTVPGPSDHAYITTPGNYTVTINSNITVGAVTLGGDNEQQTLAIAGGALILNNNSMVSPHGNLLFSNGYLAGTGILSVNGSMIWSGGTMYDTGTTAIEPGAVLTISGTASKAMRLGRLLTNAGTIQVTGTGNVTLEHTATTIDNLAGGTLDFQVDAAFRYVSSTSLLGTVRNEGTLKKTGGAGQAWIGVPFNNTGQVDVQKGELALTAGGTSTGPFTAAVGAR